jgi:ribosomal protein S18 acetylase RimI-like enzyme
MMEAHAGNWRRMARADLVSVERIGDLVHPTYPEDATVIAERLQLYPAGCLVLQCRSATQGYAISHPWLFGRPPALNTRLQDLPVRPDTFYIHDVALMPEFRRSHLGTTVVQLLVHQAKLDDLDNMSLVAVGRSLDFWRKNGFQGIEREDIRAALSSYGEGATFMARSLQ